MKTQSSFEGFLPPVSSTTYIPNQFFDVVLRDASRGAVRLVGYLMRKILGWSDPDGKPQEPSVDVTYRELEERAGMGHSMVRLAVDEALEARYIQCLRNGRCASAGTQARSGVYTLCWDESRDYITDRHRFCGFYAGCGNHTYIPNDFLDHVVAREPLAIIKVVGAIIRHTIGWQTQYGFRRQQVRMSVTALGRRTGLCRESVRLALQEALERNYLQRIDAGFFDPDAGRLSRAAQYGIRWRDGFVGQPRAVEVHSGARQAAHGARIVVRAVRHGGPLSAPPGRSEPWHGEAHRKPARVRTDPSHGMEITPSNNTMERQQQAERPAEDAQPAAVAYFRVARIYRLLRKTGYDAGAARRLATTYPSDRIERQCRWLDRRRPARNRLGLLRKAIEGDWPEPLPALPPDRPAASSAEGTPEHALARTFAACFYAGWGGNPGPALAAPSANDVQHAAPYVTRLLTVSPDPDRVGEWGRDFGSYAKRADTGNVRAIRSLVLALRTHGDEYFLQFDERRRKAHRLALVAARRRHEDRHRDDYLAYLRDRDQDLRTRHPDVYTPFRETEQQARRRLENGLGASSALRPKLVEAFEAEDQYLQRLRVYFVNHPEHPVMDFWQWDAARNPRPFANGGHPPSARPVVRSSGLEGMTLPPAGI